MSQALAPSKTSVEHSKILFQVSIKSSGTQSTHFWLGLWNCTPTKDNPSALSQVSSQKGVQNHELTAPSDPSESLHLQCFKSTKFQTYAVWAQTSPMYNLHVAFIPGLSVTWKRISMTELRSSVTWYGNEGKILPRGMYANLMFVCGVQHGQCPWSSAIKHGAD